MVATKKVRRGRPAQFDTDEAVAIALTEFHRDGYDGVGVARLGAAMGINPPSLYAAFGSKYGLFERAVELYSATAGGFITDALQSDGPVADILARMLADACDVYTQHSDRRGCLIMDGNINCTDESVVGLTLGCKQMMRKGLKALIAREAPESADAIAAYVVFVLSGLSAAARDGASKQDLLGFVDRTMLGIRKALTN